MRSFVAGMVFLYVALASAWLMWGIYLDRQADLRMVLAAVALVALTIEAVVLHVVVVSEYRRRERRRNR